MERRVVRAAGFVPVEAKLRPPEPRDQFVLRGHLVDRLVESAATPVVCVTAPAGYGKSIAVAQWVDEDPRPSAWLSLDDGDGDPVVLVTYLLLALQRVEPVDAGVLAGPGADTAELAGAVLPRLGRMLALRRRPFVLVLDDADLPATPEAHAVLQTVLDHVPDGSQVAVVGRTAPPLDWERARRTRGVLDVGPDDLRFSRQETASLLAAAGRRLADEELDALIRRAEGWPAGLSLAAMLLADSGPARSGSAVTGSAGLIAGYVRDRILARLADEDATFLTRCSLLATLSGPLCDAVLSTTSSGPTLRRLAGANVLARAPGDDPPRFRLHPFVAEALRAELLRREPQMVKVWHSRASRWLEDDGDLDAAVDHALSAGDTERTARLVWRRTPDLLATGRTSAVEAWLDRLGPRQVATHAKLSLAAAWCALQRGHSADHWIATAERGRYEAARKGEAESVAAGVALLHAMLARHGVVQMASDAHLAAALLDPEDPWRCTAALLEAVSAYLTGGRAEARASLAATERDAAVVGAHGTRALALAELALLAADDADWTAAQELGSRAAAVAHDHDLDDVPALLPVHCAGALLAAHHARAEQAAALVRRCVRMAALGDATAAWAGAQCRLVLARAELTLGDSPAARTLLSEAQTLLSELADARGLRQAVEETWRQLERVPLGPGGGASTLTTAELRVLQLLPTHLSFGEIGRRLFVSRNTVKTQAVSVYRKLGVGSRADAVERARGLGLLPRSGPAGTG